MHDLQRQLNASERALDLAEKDDFSYIGKLVPGQREGELGWMYRQEDPLLLHSIRRGDFQKGGVNESRLVQYEDSRGNPISDDEMEKLTDESGKDIRGIGKQAKDLFDALPLVESHMMGDDKVHHANTGPPDDKGNLDSPVYRPLKRLDRLCLLCESLAGSSELSSVPACAGMSCSSGAWRDSDASTLYDERTLKVALHPPTDNLKKKGVLDRARFPEADPEPNQGLGTYGATETAEPAAPMHSMFKAGRTRLQASPSGGGAPAPVSLKMTLWQAQASPPVLDARHVASGPVAGQEHRPRDTSIAAGSTRHLAKKAVDKGGQMAGPPPAPAKHAGEKPLSVAKVGAVAQRKLGRPLSEDETRAFACEYAATTKVKAHIPILERLFKNKYHKPLRCTGKERRPLHALPGEGRGGPRHNPMGALRVSPLATKASLQKKWEWSGSWENGTWVPDDEEDDDEADEGEEGETKAQVEEAGDENEDNKDGEEGDGQEDETENGKSVTAADDEGAEEEEAGEMQASEEGGGGDESVYLYVGRDAQPAFQYKMEDILSKQVG